jgi:hypothetical protein
MKLLEELNSIPVQTLQLILLFYGQKSEQKDISIFRIKKYNAKQRVVAKIKIKINKKVVQPTKLQQGTW